MKIHLNRKLLKEFFISACDVIDDSGKIIVALCHGQGGTEADKKVRRWDDSWQITEMAAHADFVLSQVQSFDESLFPNYVNIGYRSLDKSFHSKDAIVYTFQKQELPAILQNCPDRWIRDLPIKEELIFEFLEERMLNPFSNLQSASNFIFDRIINKDKLKDFYIYNSIIPLLIGSEHSNCESDEQVFTRDQKHDSITTVFSKLYEESGSKNVVSRVLAKQLFTKDFSTAPTRCLVFIFGTDNLTTLLNELFSETLKLFESGGKLSFKELSSTIYQCVHICNSNKMSCKKTKVFDVILLHNGISVHICYVDALAQVLFKLDDWRMLWNGDVGVSKSGHPSFYPISLFPKEYSFDLGLSVPLEFKEEFENEFFVTLWLTAGDIITKTELLSTYLPSDREIICFCYRLTYKAFKGPLYRQRTIYIHEQIIANLVSKYLKINIT